MQFFNLFKFLTQSEILKKKTVKAFQALVNTLIDKTKTDVILS